MDEQTPDLEVLLKRLDALEAKNARLREENARLRQRVQDLEYQLAQNSSNSHCPPSTDDPWDDDEDDDDHDDEIVFDFQERRQQGAQPGHTGHHRRLADPEDVDEVVDLTPDEFVKRSPGESSCPCPSGLRPPSRSGIFFEVAESSACAPPEALKKDARSRGGLRAVRMF